MTEKFTWPAGARAAVSLTYDDGLVTQLEKALPQLKEHGLKATFFPSGDGLKDPANLLTWQEAVRCGHEIGMHTLNHPCDSKFEFVRPGFSLQEYDEARLKTELNDNIRIARSFGYNNENLVFAYPCGDMNFGPDMARSYVPVIKSMFRAARGVIDITADPLEVDLYNVPCFGVECDGDGMIELVRQAEAKGHWLVILFHGISGDYISVTQEAHQKLLGYLKANEGKIWTDTFGSVASYIKKKRSM